MSERERWIVYPLLFLALGVGLREEFIDRTSLKNVICQALVAIEEDPTHPQRFPKRIAMIGTKQGTIDEVSEDGLLRVDTVWARNVMADNFTSRDRRMNIIPYLIQLLGSRMLSPADQRPEIEPQPPVSNDIPSESEAGQDPGPASDGP